MTRRKFIAGNWKMNLGPGDADALAQELRRQIVDFGAVDVAVAPPFLSIPEVVSRLKATGILVAAQNLHWESSGAYTGELSADMIKRAGCAAVIIGHSERRQFFGETDRTVNQKLGAALKAGLIPILCIGETLAERDAGEAVQIVERQLQGGLAGIDDEALAKITLAYEPVWAIGTGRTATPQQAQEMHKAIRDWMAARYNTNVVAGVRIQYGGSVTAANAASLLCQPDIDGALVGGASLKAESFARIVEAGSARQA